MQWQGQESREDYLKAILVIWLRKGCVRQVDIAEDMGVSKASVSVAMKKLARDGLVTLGENSAPALTEAGRETAERFYERSQILTGVLEALGVRPEQAAKDACRAEHVLSEESFQAIKAVFRRAVREERTVRQGRRVRGRR